MIDTDSRMKRDERRRRRWDSIGRQHRQSVRYSQSLTRSISPFVTRSRCRGPSKVTHRFEQEHCPNVRSSVLPVERYRLKGRRVIPASNWYCKMRSDKLIYRNNTQKSSILVRDNKFGGMPERRSQGDRGSWCLNPYDFANQFDFAVRRLRHREQESS